MTGKTHSRCLARITLLTFGKPSDLLALPSSLTTSTSPSLVSVQRSKERISKGRSDKGLQSAHAVKLSKDVLMQAGSASSLCTALFVRLNAAILRPDVSDPRMLSIGKLFVCQSAKMGRYAGVAGGFLMNLCAGSLNAWGTLSLYIVSYYHLTDSDASLSLFLVVFPLWCLCDGPGIYLADLLYRRSGVKVTTAVAGVVFSAGYFAASYARNSLVFLLLFGVVTGMGEGLTLMTPIWNSWKNFPTLKGRISGLLLLGYGCGSPIFGIVFTLLMNPHNEPATEHVREGQASYYLFPSAVAENMPSVMRLMAFIFLALYVVATLLQTDAPAASDAPPATKVPVKAALRSLAFWQLLMALSLSRSFPIYLLNVYKALGQKFYSDDYFLSALGSVMMTSSAVGRFALPFAADYLSFRKLLTASLLGQAVFGATLWFVAAWEVAFALWLSIIVFVSGGYLSLFAMETSVVFGSELGPRVFSFVSQGFTVASLIALFAFSYVAPEYGYEVSFWLFTVLLLASAALVLMPMKRFAQEPLLSAS